MGAYVRTVNRYSSVKHLSVKHLEILEFTKNELELSTFSVSEVQNDA